jgi:hypothetical protein
MEDPSVIGNGAVRRLAALAALVAGCSVPSPADSAMPPEVTLHDVRLRNFHRSTLSAVGTVKRMTYERSTADVRSTDVVLDVFRLDPPPPPGARPPTTRLRAGQALGNLLTKAVDASDGVTVRTPSGLLGTTSQAFFETTLMRATGSVPVVVEGPDGFWLRADGFDLDLRNEVYDFVHPETRTRGP